MLRQSIIAAIFAAVSLAPLSAALAGPSDTPGAPATHGAAAKDATGKPGAVRPKHPASAKQLAQRQKMKSCSADAKSKGLKGADRKAYMKTCLKG